MSGILVDTSAYSHLLRGNRRILEHIRSASRVCVNPMILAELRSGFSQGRRLEENEALLHKFLAAPSAAAVDITAATASHYVRVFMHLRQLGTPIPTNDIWIAASALEHGLTLITTDQHFSRIPMVSCVIEPV